MVETRLSDLSHTLQAVGARDIRFLWSDRKTYFRGFEVDKELVGRLVVAVLPGCSYSVKAEGGKYRYVFRRAADGVPDLRRRLERVEGQLGRGGRRKVVGADKRGCP